MKSHMEWLGVTPKILRDRRDSGDETASILLSFLIASGVIEPNAADELEQSLSVAANKHPLAGLAYARELLRSSRGNKLEAVRLLEKSSTAGISRASTLLGFLHEAGLHCNKDLSLARSLYEMAAKQGDPLGWGFLAALYIDHTGAISEPDLAEPYLKKAVEAGHWPSAFFLAKLYFSREDPKLAAKALELLESGASNGDFACLSRLAQIYMHGEHGKKRDIRHAESLNNRALAAQKSSQTLI